MIHELTASFSKKSAEDDDRDHRQMEGRLGQIPD
jgi:hypothetical protein